MKNNSFSFLIFAIFVIGLLSAPAYSETRSGYIVKLSGDTVRGSFEEQSWKVNPDIVRFAQTGGHSRPYGMSEIIAFGSDEFQFEKWKVDLDVSLQDKIENMSEARTPVMAPAELFLRVIVRGSATLYLFNDSTERNHFFIGKDSGSPVVLISYKYLTSRDSKEVVVANQKYRQQLSYYFQDCKEAISLLYNLEYTESDMLSVFNTFNKWKDPAFVSSKKHRPTRLSVELRAHAGAVTSAIKIKSNDPHKSAFFSDMEKIDLPVTINFYGGISCNLEPGFFGAKWSLYNEICYTHYHSKGESPSESVLQYHKWSGDFDHTLLQLFTALRYQTRKSGFRFYFQAGVCNVLILSRKSELSYRTYFAGQPLDQTVVPASIQRKYEQGIFAGFGFLHKRWGVDFRYNSMNGFIEIYEAKATAKEVALGLSFLLNK